MQKHPLLSFTLFALLGGALLAGCDSKEKPAASPMQTLATTEPPGDVGSPVPAQTSEQPQQNLIDPQAVSDATPDPANLAIGEKVYKSTCSICHKSGLNGAPRMGSKQDWESRLAQGNEVLYSRAINGYRGSKGSMPSRGSNPRLTEAEVKAAVDYIVANAVPSWSVE